MFTLHQQNRHSTTLRCKGFKLQQYEEKVVHLDLMTESEFHESRLWPALASLISAIKWTHRPILKIVVRNVIHIEHVCQNVPQPNWSLISKWKERMLRLVLHHPKRVPEFSSGDRQIIYVAKCFGFWDFCGSVCPCELKKFIALPSFKTLRYRTHLDIWEDFRIGDVSEFSYLACDTIFECWRW